MGKKHRNRINQPKKKNNIPPDILTAERLAHEKENSARRRKP